MVSSDTKPVRELLRFPTSWEMLIIQGVSVAIVVFSPDDVLTRYQILSEFVEVVAGWFPPVLGYQRVSEFPQVTGLYFSVMFFVTPLLLSYSFRMRAMTLEGIALAYEKGRVRYWFIAPFVCAFCLMVVPFFSYWWADGNDEWFPSMPLKSSKLALATLGWFVAGGGAWMLAPFALCISFFLARKVLKT